MGKRIDGKEVAQAIKDELAGKVSFHVDAGNRPPCLAVVLVGNDPASVSYVTGKHAACRNVGILSRDIHLDDTASRQEILTIVKTLNDDDEVDGILVQLPLPDHVDDQEVLLAISPDKDVDGFHPVSLGRLMAGVPGFLPCTPNGIVEMLIRSGIEISGKHVCIVGRSNIVGKPLMNLLLRKGKRGDATVTVCHSRSENLGSYTREADILVAAVGKARMITPDMVKTGAVVIDVGVNRIEDSSRKKGFRLVGDVDYDGVLEKVSYITPVPGGVGPMTIAMLMNNTVASYEKTMEERR